MNNKIQSLLSERKFIWDKWQETFDETLGDYTEDEPNQIDVLGDSIFKMIKNHHANLDVDFIIETLTKLGHAPNIIYDDDGRFAVSGNGFMAIHDGDMPYEHTIITIEIEKGQWFDNIREALIHYIND